jgi:inner membrane protein
MLPPAVLAGKGAFMNMPRARGAQTSFVLKIVLLGFLWLALLIPLFLVRALVEERQAYQNQVISEVGQEWGGPQTLAGPILTVPVRYTERYVEDKQEKTRTTVRWQNFLPEDLEVTGEIEPLPRKRGIFETVVYRSELQVQGTFAQPKLLHEIEGAQSETLWADATVHFSISDLRGLRSALDLQWDGRPLQLTPSVYDPAQLGLPVLSAPIVLADRPAGAPYAFALKLGVNGSGDLKFLPLGRQTTVELRSKWPNPRFHGAFLPDERRIDAAGFSARWQIPYYARSFPQAWLGTAVPQEMGESAFGLALPVPVDAYVKSDRSLKYAGLFVLLTFLAFLLFEVFERRHVHVIQYLLVGFAMSLFYLLLLSLSEQMPFATAYCVSAAAVTLLIAGYARAVLRSGRGSLILGAVLALLYAFLYVLLQSQDYALLVGSVALFLVLAIVMYVTRHIDWSGTGTEDDDASAIGAG